MTIYSLNGTYNGRSNDELDVYFVLFDSNGRNSNEGKTTLIQSKTPFKESWDHHKSIPSEQLTFKIAVVNKDGSYIDANKQEVIKGWLDTGKLGWLQFNQEDLYNKYYYCIINNPEPIDVGMQNAGYGFNVTCDCNHAWSKLYTNSYSSTTSTTFSIINNVLVNEYTIEPYITVKSNNNGNISIKNNTTNVTLSINNCTSNEIINIDCKNNKQASSTGRILLDSWNKNYLKLIKGVNNVTLTGNFSMTLSYRLPVMVGG